MNDDLSHALNDQNQILCLVFPCWEDSATKHVLISQMKSYSSSEKGFCPGELNTIKIKVEACLIPNN